LNGNIDTARIWMRWVELALWVMLCEGIGLVGGRWTGPEIPGWYRTLRKPSFNPPSWVFAPVWTTLYLLMAIAAWLVAGAEESTARTVSLFLFFVQLALNLAWSWIFFRKHAIAAAAMELFVLWASIVAMVYAFGQSEPVGAWLLAPYLGWVSFAAVLNASIWRLNPSAG
jgi:translocator protein